MNVEKREGTSYTLVGMQTGVATVATVWRFLKELKTKLPYALAISLLGIYLENSYLKRYVHPNVHRSIIYKGQDMQVT